MSRRLGFSQQLLHLVQLILLILRNPEGGGVRIAHHAKVLLPPSRPDVAFLGGQELTAQNTKPASPRV